MDGISWANLTMLLATIPTFESKATDEVIDIAPENEVAELKRSLGML